MPVNKKEFADRMAAKGGIKKKDCSGQAFL